MYLIVRKMKCSNKNNKNWKNRKGGDGVWGIRDEYKLWGLIN
jgi:hypothetical protein